MKIKQPNFKVNGKIIIEYQGANTNNFYKNSIISKVIFHNTKRINLKAEDTVLEFIVQDGTEIFYCLTTKAIYFKTIDSDTYWHEPQPNNCEIIHDYDNIYFFGKFSFTKAITLNFVAKETYSFTGIFNKNKSIMIELDFAKLLNP